jgi:hypothetical protein
MAMTHPLFNKLVRLPKIEGKFLTFIEQTACLPESNKPAIPNYSKNLAARYRAGLY